MAKVIVTGDEWMDLVLRSLGIVGPVDRIVVDAVPGKPLTIYITHYGTPSLLDVRPPEAREVEIVTVGGEGD